MNSIFVYFQYYQIIIIQKLLQLINSTCFICNWILERI